MWNYSYAGTRWDTDESGTHRDTKKTHRIILSLYGVLRLRFKTRWTKFHTTLSQPVDDHEREILWSPQQFAATNTAIDNYGLIHWNRNIGILQSWAVDVLIREIHLFLVREINPSRQLIRGKTMIYERFVTNEKIEQATSASCDDIALPGCWVELWNVLITQVMFVLTFNILWTTYLTFTHEKGKFRI